MNRLIDIIAAIENVGYVPSKYYNLTLIPPIVLILQLIEMTMSSVGNIMGIFQTGNIKFDPYYFLEKYIPYIPWDEFRLKSEEYERKVNVKASVEGIETTTPPPVSYQ